MVNTIFRLDLLDDEDNRTTATVAPLLPPPPVVGNSGPIALAFQVRASRQDEVLHASTWGISGECMDLWGDIAPSDPESRKQWYGRGVLVQFCRRFHHQSLGDTTEFVINRGHHDDFAAIKKPLGAVDDVDDALAVIESELIDFLLWSTPLRPQLAQPSTDEYEVPYCSAAWEAHEPLIRDRRDAGDPNIKRLYPILDDYYRELSSIREHGTGYENALPRLLRVMYLAARALRAVDEGLTSGMPMIGAPVDIHAGVQSPSDRGPAMKIATVDLENIRCFDKIHIDLISHDKSRSWAVVVGDNAHGKSTLLRAIALSLCKEADAAALLKEMPGRLIRDGSESGRITVRLEGSEHDSCEIVTEIHQQEGTEILRRPDGETAIPWDRIFVCGYGPQRASLATASHSRYEARFAVSTLFDYEASLQNPELVLRRSSPQARRRMERALLDVLMLGDQTDVVVPRDRGVELVGPWGKWSLVTLSDGYRSTVQWILDLCSWAMYAGRFEPDGSISGIVLIDELEQHLHPRWQRYIVKRLHEQFPSIQFFASTHTPIVAAGLADLDDALILALDQDEATRATLAEPIESHTLRGLRADQVLTSRAFDLVTTRSPGSVSDIARYSELEGKASRTEAEDRELAMLRDDLRERLVFGETPLQRKVEQAVRDVLDGMQEETEAPGSTLEFELKRKLRELVRGDGAP